jgi:hypothetical protein
VSGAARANARMDGPELPQSPVAAAAVQAKADGEHVSAHTLRCVSERRSRPTPAWTAPAATVKRPR